MTDENNDAGNESWRDSLPEALRGAKFIADAETPEAFAQQLTHLADYMGNSIRMPTSEAAPEIWEEFNGKLMDKVPGLMRKPNAETPEEMAEVMRALGAPTEADEYSVTGIDGAPEGELLGQLRAEAHALNMTQEQFRRWVSKGAEQNAAAMTEAKAAHDMAYNELRGEWGQAFDSKVATAVAAMERSGEDQAVIDAAKEGQLPAGRMKYYANLANQLGIGTTQAQGAFQGKGAPPKVFTPTEARQRAEELLVEMDNPNMSPAMRRMKNDERVKMMELAVI